jgi:Zn-dependent protease with chaperone function
MAQGWLYDGRSALRHDVRIQTRDLMHLESRPHSELYSHKERHGWRLGIAVPVPPEIASSLPGRIVYGGIIDRLGLGKTLLIGTVASAAILYVGHSAPRWLAPHVPFAWEQKFGNALVGDLGNKFCTGSGGQQALDRLTAKLSPSAGRFKVRVVDIPMVNAVALPGGTIVLFKPLLQEAESADEVAGVLGHEVAHIEKRHVTEAMIRHYGLSLLISSLGGTTGTNINALTSANYTRAGEREADEGSIEALRRANISPRPTAGFFERLTKREPGLGRLAEPLSYVSTHPLSAERRRRFEANFQPRRQYEPSLSPEEWNALKNICGGGGRR